METKEPQITPVYHASFLMEWAGKVIYVDPAWDPSYYLPYPKPDLALITDVHFDHLDNNVLGALKEEKGAFEIICPPAVLERLRQDLKERARVLENGESTEWEGFQITAFPMYNITPERLQYHPKGRGNAYIVEREGFRVYIAGDTENIPEMAELENIDIAFIPMNLPYTMDVEQAVEAVLSFNPKKVYPYHYKSELGFSDVNKFKEELSQKALQIEVVLSDWYKGEAS